MEVSARAARVLVLVSWALLYTSHPESLFLLTSGRETKFRLEAENIGLLGLAERQVTGVMHPFIFIALETNNTELATKLLRVACFMKLLLCPLTLLGADMKDRVWNRLNMGWITHIIITIPTSREHENYYSHESNLACFVLWMFCLQAESAPQLDK